MKRVIIALVVLVFAGFSASQTVKFTGNWGQHPLFNVVSERSNGVDIVFSMHQMVIEEIEVDGKVMQVYGVPSVFIAEPGKPNLIGASRYVAIPQGAEAQVVILDARTEVYHEVDVAPAPNIPLETDDKPLVYQKDMTIYSKDAYWPSSPVKISEEGQIRGVDVVVVGVIPFQYNPVRRELIVYKDIRFRIDFIGGNGHFGEDRLRNPYWEPILQGHLLNYNSLPKIDFYSPERLNSRAGWEYIIIVPDDSIFIAWADTIKRWRQLQGISTKITTLTEIGGNNATLIENYLNNAYNTWNPAPVAFLILSDYQSSGDDYGITSPVWNNYCVSDNIYADVNGDNLPDMHHGRICAQNHHHLSKMINKMLSYERNPYTAANFYNNPLVACGWQDDRWFQLAAEVCRGYWINVQGKNPARQYNLGSPANPTPGCLWSTRPGTAPVVAYWNSYGYIPLTNPYNSTWWDNGSASGINNAINSGAFFVQHRDHGATYGWGEPDYDTLDLDGLTNTMYTFVNSTNCATGMYDQPYQVFAEKFHRIPYGALGVNAASDVSYSFVNDTYLWGMWDCLWPNFDPNYPTFDLVGYGNLRPCFAMTYGKYYLRNMWFPDSAQAGVARVYTYHLYHHFGDVFMTLYSQIPGSLTVSHPPTLITGATSFPVSANDSSIIALTVDGEIIGVAMGTGSVVNITIPAQAPGKRVIVTVTKYNYQRYEAIVPVVYSNYPYVIMGREIINDSGGDGKINPGETVDYGVYGKNIGQGTAQQVYGKLTETSSYVTVSIDSSWYGNIAQNDSVLGNPYYRFVVANNCPNGHQINFTLNFYDFNDTVFTSHRSLSVYAPALTYQSYQVTGGNGNGILDPGETANLVVTIKNDGCAVAPNITGVLMENSPYITINDAQGSFGTLNPGATGSNSSDVFTVTAVGNAPIGTVVPLQMELTSGIYCDTVDFEIMIGRIMPSDTGYYYVYWSGCPYPQYAPVYSWFPIDTTQTANPGVSLNLGVDQTVVISLPFIFKYYGRNYYVVSICSNGWLVFNPTSSTSHSNLWIPDTTLPNAAVFAFWTYLNPGVPGEPSDVYYYSDTANHRFVVEWFRVQNPTHFPTTYPTFQIILYDPTYYPTPTGDGEIVIQYYDDVTGNIRTIGIENPTGTVGIQYYYNGTYHPLAVPITPQFALKFTTYPMQTVIKEERGVNLEPVNPGLMLEPNPFRERLMISYMIQDAGYRNGVVSSQYPVASNNGVTSSQQSVVSLKIYDASGRMVRDLSRLTVNGERSTILWDGTDDSGRKLPSGIYFVRLETDEFNRTEKIILLR